jgi:hypothetical protein
MVINTWLQPERPGVEIPAGTVQEIFFLFSNTSRPAVGLTQPPYFLRTEILSRGENLLPITHILLAPRLSMSEVMHLISLRTFTAWTDTALTFYLYLSLDEWLKFADRFRIKFHFKTPGGG